MTLESVITTPRLRERAARDPDYAAENRALVSLARHLATSPGDVLQRLVESALEVCHAHSAGLSLVEEEAGKQIFRWPAIAGAFAEHVRGTTPRDFSPCGVVLDTNDVQLFDRPGRHYPYLAAAEPPIVEALLQPFSVAGRPVGTLWVMAHDEERKFDTEDARALKSLASFAASAYQVLFAIDAANVADRKKDEFLALLSHEIRSPLQTVLTWSKLLKAAGGDEAAMERGRDAIERNAGAMARMIEDLLDVSKITAGKLSLELASVDLAAIVRESVDAVLGIAAEREIAVDTVIEAPLPARGDPTRLHQIVGNVLSNALKFTPAGGLISVRASRAGRNAAIVVSDTGEGIAAESLPRIFDRFHQGDASVTRRHGGLGIGLAVARQLAELHGGTIVAESDGPGRGATFRIRLPLGD